MISPTRYFEIYNACTLHFKENSSYDFFKYAGKTSVKEDTLLKRKDKMFFQRAAAKSSDEEMATIFTFMNFIMDKKYIMKFDWNLHRDFVSYRDALFYRTKQDLDKYSVECPINTMLSGSLEPVIYIIVMDTLTNGGLFDHYNKKFGADNILWVDLKSRLNKARPFLVYYLGLNKETCEKLKAFVRGPKD